MFHRNSVILLHPLVRSVKFNSCFPLFRNHPGPISFYATEATLVNDVEKLAPVDAKFWLKKRSFTVDEQRSSFGKLVYVSPVKKIIYRCKVFSLSTSLITLIISPIILTMPKITENGYAAPAVFSIFSTLFLFTPLLLDQITKAIVMEMYYNSNRNIYTTTHMNILLAKRALQFRLDDLKAVGAASAMLSTHTVGKYSLLLHRSGYSDLEVCREFESMLDQLEYDEGKDDDDNDEPAKATTDHHKRQQDQ